MIVAFASKNAKAVGETAKTFLALAIRLPIRRGSFGRGERNVSVLNLLLNARVLRVALLELVKDLV